MLYALNGRKVIVWNCTVETTPLNVGCDYMSYPFILKSILCSLRCYVLLFFYLVDAVFPLFMLYFEIKRYLCGVKYDTNIKKYTLI